MTFFKDLEFDLPSALLDQLTALFNEMSPVSLDSVAVGEVPEAQGVYQLFYEDRLVYVGKTDADAGLRARLTRHARKIRSRLVLSPESVSFKAVRVYVFTAMDLEDLLIKYYRERNVTLDWNLSGFGSNDPGRNRDKTKLKERHFDRRYPIDLGLNVQIEQLSIAGGTVAEVLKQLKDKLAYTVRFQNKGGKSKHPHEDLIEARVTLRSATDNVESILRQVAGSLGLTWQITALPGYVIIYKERQEYPHSLIIR